MSDQERHTEELPNLCSDRPASRSIRASASNRPQNLVLSVVHPARLGGCIAIALLASLFTPAATAGPNPPQEGSGGACLDFNALYLVPDLQIDTIQVAGGTGYIASQTGGAEIYIDFYDAEGRWIGDNSHNRTKTPERAVIGTICVGTIGEGWPDLPDTDATWSYQDGLETTPT